MKSVLHKICCAGLLLCFLTTTAYAEFVSSPQKKDPTLVEAIGGGNDYSQVPGDGSDYLVLTPYRSKENINHPDREEQFDTAVYSLDKATANNLLQDYLEPGMKPENMVQYSIMYLHEKLHTDSVPLPVTVGVQTTLKQGQWVQVLAYYDTMPSLRAAEPRIMLLSNVTPNVGLSSGRWQRIDSSLDEDGVLHFEAKELCPYMVVTYVVQETPVVTDPTSGTNGSSGNSGSGGSTVPQSPQTGYEPAHAGIGAAACLIGCAGILSLRRRRQR